MRWIGGQGDEAECVYRTERIANSAKEEMGHVYLWMEREAKRKPLREKERMYHGGNDRRREFGGSMRIVDKVYFISRSTGIRGITHNN